MNDCPRQNPGYRLTSNGRLFGGDRLIRADLPLKENQT